MQVRVDWLVEYRIRLDRDWIFRYRGPDEQLARNTANRLYCMDSVTGVRLVKCLEEVVQEKNK